MFLISYFFSIMFKVLLFIWFNELRLKINYFIENSNVHNIVFILKIVLLIYRSFHENQMTLLIQKSNLYSLFLLTFNHVIKDFEYILLTSTNQLYLIYISYFFCNLMIENELITILVMLMEF